MSSPVLKQNTLMFSKTLNTPKRFHDTNYSSYEYKQEIVGQKWHDGLKAQPILDKVEPLLPPCGDGQRFSSLSKSVMTKSEREPCKIDSIQNLSVCENGTRRRFESPEDVFQNLFDGKYKITNGSISFSKGFNDENVPIRQRSVKESMEHQPIVLPTGRFEVPVSTSNATLYSRRGAATGCYPTMARESESLFSSGDFTAYQEQPNLQHLLSKSQDSSEEEKLDEEIEEDSEEKALKEEARRSEFKKALLKDLFEDDSLDEEDIQEAFLGDIVEEAPEEQALESSNSEEFSEDKFPRNCSQYASLEDFNQEGSLGEEETHENSFEEESTVNPKMPALVYVPKEVEGLRSCLKTSRSSISKAVVFDHMTFVIDLYGEDPTEITRSKREGYLKPPHQIRYNPNRRIKRRSYNAMRRQAIADRQWEEENSKKVSESVRLGDENKMSLAKDSQDKKCDYPKEFLHEEPSVRDDTKGASQGRLPKEPLEERAHKNIAQDSLSETTFERTSNVVVSDEFSRLKDTKDKAKNELIRKALLELSIERDDLEDVPKEPSCEVSSIEEVQEEEPVQGRALEEHPLHEKSVEEVSLKSCLRSSPSTFTVRTDVRSVLTVDNGKEEPVEETWKTHMCHLKEDRTGWPSRFLNRMKRALNGTPKSVKFCEFTTAHAYYRVEPPFVTHPREYEFVKKGGAAVSSETENGDDDDFKLTKKDSKKATDQPYDRLFPNEWNKWNELLGNEDWDTLSIVDPAAKALSQKISGFFHRRFSLKGLKKSKPSKAWKSLKRAESDASKLEVPAKVKVLTAEGICTSSPLTLVNWDSENSESEKGDKEFGVKAVHSVVKKVTLFFTRWKASPLAPMGH